MLATHQAEPLPGARLRTDAPASPAPCARSTGPCAWGTERSDFGEPALSRAKGHAALRGRGNAAGGIVAWPAA